MARHPSSDSTDASEYLARALSDIELLTATDVVRSVIAEGRRHVDLDALKRVLAKLTAAYQWKQRHAGSHPPAS